MKLKVYNQFDKKIAKGDRKGGKAKKGDKPSIPMNEFQEMAKLKDQKMRCRYWNSSVGCARGSDCSFKHECMQCGDRNHTFASFHLGV